MKKLIPLLLALLPLSAGACPTDVIQPFAASWEGEAVLTLASGKELRSGTRDVISMSGCKTFEIDVSYLDKDGAVARTLHLTAKADAAKPRLFNVEGTSSEGATHSTMTGTIEASVAGTLLGSFSGAIGDQKAYLSEVMELDGDRLTRTVQMSAREIGDHDIGVRVVRDRR